VSTKSENLSAEDMSELLLDYAKNRLSADVRLDVEAAAAQSPEVLEELEYYKGLARAAELETEQTDSAGELGWARLSRAIEQAELEAVPPAAANDNARFWRYAAMALGLVVMGQFAVQLTQQNAADDARYVPVTASVAGVSAQITFAPDATEAAIRELLLSAQASIVSGPSAIGVYQLGFADEAARERGLAMFEDATAIVESSAAQ